jgi:hypothetical protein
VVLGPQRLGEDIGEVEVRVDVMQSEVAQLEEFTEVEVAERDVLGAGVEHPRVLAQLDGALVVAVESGQDRRMAEVCEQGSQPHCFLGCHGTCVEFSLAGGEGN